MATRRRSAGTRRAGGARLPAWAWMLIGLLIGAGVAWAAHLYITRSTKPKPAPAAVAQPAPTRPAAKKPEPKPLPPPAAKPRFDFYTILPEMETVLPDKEPRAAKPKPSVETDARYILQAGSFANFDDADRLKARLALAGLEARIEKISIEGKGEYFRVRLGPYPKLEQLEAQNKRLAELGVHALRIKVKNAPG